MISSTDDLSTGNRLRVAVSGASGLLGANLTHFLERQQVEVYRLVRTQAQRGDRTIYWDAEAEDLEIDRLEGMDGVVHLAGEKVLQWPWTKEKKRRIFDSRVRGTRFLSESLGRLRTPPRVLLAASGISYYGDRGADWVDEASLPDEERFLARVCVHWEEAGRAAVEAGIRVVNLRIGIVLGPERSLLQRIAPLFRVGLGAMLTGKNPYISWISIDDTIRSMYQLLRDDDAAGPVNLVSPNPVTQQEFATLLADHLNRPLVVRAPSSVVRLLLGDLGEETVLTSTRVRPTKLIQAGFHFTHPTLSSAFSGLLPDKRPKKG